jgi:hypothetical protein
MGLLALGVVGGYGSGIAHLSCWRRHHEAYREQMMREFAQHCVDAAHAAPGSGRTVHVESGAQPGGVTVVVDPGR